MAVAVHILKLNSSTSAFEERSLFSSELASISSDEGTMIFQIIYLSFLFHKTLSTNSGNCGWAVAVHILKLNSSTNALDTKSLTP